jgi:hypothetical protein
VAIKKRGRGGAADVRGSVERGREARTTRVGPGRVGRGRAGRGHRRGELGEDGPQGERVQDGGDDAQAATTAGTGKDIEVEHAAQQRRPGPDARGAGGAGTGLELARIVVPGRAVVADDLRAPARMWGEDAVIQDQVDHGAGNDGRELFEELDRLEEEMGGAIAPHRLECDEDASVGPELDAVLGERGPGWCLESPW